MTEEQIAARQPLQSGRCQKITVLGQLWSMKFYVFCCFSTVIILFFDTNRDFYRGIAIGMGLTITACILRTAHNRARNAMENQGFTIRQTKDWLGWLCCLLIWTALALRIWIALI